MKPVIRFRNKTQVVLFECELKGQISDGMWENSSPRDHWKTPCDATCTVAAAGEELGPNFFPRRTYNFSNPELLEIVGDRMIAYVKAAVAFPDLSTDQIGELDFTFLNLLSSQDEYWIRKRQEIEAFVKMPLHEAFELIGKVEFTLADLKKELDDMKKIYASKFHKEA